jgi:hypothetical protein
MTKQTGIMYRFVSGGAGISFETPNAGARVSWTG